MRGRRDESTADLLALSDAQWRDLEERATRTEEALRSSAPPLDLTTFLPPRNAAHRLAVLHELIKTELEACYRAGQRCLLEEYLDRYPELGGADTLPANLIHEEYYVRHNFGDRPALHQYRARFPRQFEELQLLAGGTVEEEAEPIVLQELVGYQKLKLLGQGKFGEVWKALAPGGVEVAIKFVFRKIERELKALEEIKRLRHPHLLQTHSYGTMEGKLVIVMELADMSLSERYQQCLELGLPGIPKEWLATYFKQAAAALDFLRHERVTHRDIKPENLLIQHGQCKVADFGLARAQGQRLEPVWTIAGTPRYMAPEIWKQQVSSHSDQYSLAATYVHMRLGRPLFDGTEFEVMEQHVQVEPKLDPLPPAEQAVLRIALAKDPDHRYPTCETFASALDEAIKPPPPPLPATVPPPPSRSVGLILTIASVVFVLIALLVVNLGPSRERPSWQPKGWEPENAEDFVFDRDGRRFYRRLTRTVKDQRVVMVAVPRTSIDDPSTFYIMENKVWNDLYGALYREASMLLPKYTSRPNCDSLGSPDSIWKLGGLAGTVNIGVDGENGKLPVFRVTPTEAQCFAEALDSRHGALPSWRQWYKAIGKGEDNRYGPYDGESADTKDLAVNLADTGPWPVDYGQRDVSIFGVRQMATNGSEWTRDLQNDATIPLDSLPKASLAPAAYVFGRSYRQPMPLLFMDLDGAAGFNCAERYLDVGFRVVLQE